MNIGSKEQIDATKEAILSLLLEMRFIAEDSSCDPDALSDAIKEIDSALALTKSAFMLAGHKSDLAESSEQFQPYTKRGVKKKIFCVERNEVYNNIAEAHRATGVNAANIHQVLRGVNKTAGGCHWIYVSPHSKECKNRKREK